MIDKLNIYKKLIQKWNKVHNLTGNTKDIQLEKNIQDSLYPTLFLDDFNSCVDIGSGAGFPAIALAIYYQDRLFTLVEPRAKRASFLRYAVSTLNLNNVEIINDKVENIKNTEFDLVTSRAVADTKTLFKLSKNIVNKDTKYLFYKGENVTNEVDTIKSYEIVSKDQRNYLYIKEL